MSSKPVHATFHVSLVADEGEADTWASPDRFVFDSRQAIIAIGADAGNDIVLADRGGRVSGQHAVLLRYDGDSSEGLLRDLASSNGTFAGEERGEARRLEQLYFERRARIFIGPFRLDIQLASERDPWERVFFADSPPLLARRTDAWTEVARRGADSGPPAELLSLLRRRPDWEATVAEIAQLLDRGIGRTTALDALVRRLRRTLAATHCVIRVRSGNERTVLPRDSPPVRAPRAGAQAAAEGRAQVEGPRMIVPLLEGFAAARGVVGDCTVVREGPQAPHFGDDDAMLVTGLAAWVLQSCPTHSEVPLARPFAARPWPVRLVGIGKAHRELMMQIGEAALSRAARVLLCGPTGVGKSYIAEEIHRLSKGRPDTFLTVNCGNTDTVSISAELFGIKDLNFKGNRVGKFERANGGTVFLDEVHALTPQIQQALKSATGATATTRVKFSPLNVADPKTSNVRIVSATTEDLSLMVKRGEFDAALLRRLNDKIIDVPTLAARPEDIPMFALRILDGFAADDAEGAAPVQLTAGAKRALIQHLWPSNVAQLKHVMRAAYDRARACAARGDLLDDRPRRCTAADTDEAAVDIDDPAAADCKPGRGETVVRRNALIHIVIDIDDLRLAPSAPAPARSDERAAPTSEELELEHVVRVLRDLNGSIEAASARLGRSPQTIYTKLDNWCLPRRLGRPDDGDAAPSGAEAQAISRALAQAAVECATKAPRWDAKPKDLSEFYARAMAGLSAEGRTYSGLRVLLERMDALRIPRHHPRTTEVVRLERRARVLRDGFTR